MLELFKNILKIYFLFFKIIFNISILKLFKNTKKILIYFKKIKIKLNFFKKYFSNTKINKINFFHSQPKTFQETKVKSL